MRFRFKLRTLMLLTFVAALLVFWFGQPLYERTREKRAIARLGEMGVPVSAYKNSFRHTFARRFFSKDTFLRVTKVKVPRGKFTPAVFSELKSFRYLAELDVTNSSMTNEQCLEIAKVTELRILDCAGTPISYATLQEVRRRKPGVCMLDHRRALSELRRRGYRLSTIYDYARRDTGAIRFEKGSAAWAEEAIDVIEAFRHVRRPIGQVRIDLDDLSAPQTDALLQSRNDFHIWLTVREIPDKTRILSETDLQRIATSRVRWLELCNVDIEPGAQMPELSLEFLHIAKGSERAIRMLTKTQVESLLLETKQFDQYDAKCIPSSVKKLALRNSLVKPLDLSHCKSLELCTFWGADWRGDDVVLLTLPELWKYSLVSHSHCTEVRVFSPSEQTREKR